MVLGKVPSFDVELWVVPTLDVHPQENPVTLTMPTRLTVGPADFWGGTSNLGVFSTGFNARVPLEMGSSTIWPIVGQCRRSILQLNQQQFAQCSGSHRRGQSRIIGAPQRLRIRRRRGIPLLSGSQQAGLAGYRGYHGDH